jgi:uncharacterized protein (TIGR03546 family)
MIFLLFICKILAIFRGSVSPVMIFISIMLGFWFGLVPDFAGFHVAVIALVFVLNVHLGLFLLSAALGKGLCFAAAPVLYHIGVVVQDNLSGLLNALASVPVIGLTDFSRYAVAGALVVGPVIGAVAGLLMARSVIGFRRALLKFEEGSERFKKWYSNRWIRILDRVLIGKRTKDAKSLFTAKTKIIRKAGVAVAVLILGGSAVAMHFVKDNLVKDYAAKTMTKANGAEVNLENLDLSLGGSVSVTGIQVTDPNKPANNQVAIDKIAADASIYDLLLGRLVMQNVEVSNVRFDEKRAAPGEVVEKPAEEPEPFDPCEYTVTLEDIAKLDKYFKDAKALKEKLEKARKWLPKSEEQAEAEAEPEAEPEKHLEYLVARAPAAVSPRLMAQRILVEKVLVPSNLFGNSDVLMENISNAPQAANLPVTFAMKSNETGANLKVKFDYSTDDPVPKVAGDFNDLDLSRLKSSLSSDSGLTFNSGTASGTFNGIVTDRSIDLTIILSVRNMDAEPQGGELLGLDPKIASEALSALDNVDTRIRVVGPITEPRLVFDVKGLQEAFKKAAVEAGKERLGEEIDRQIEKNLGDKAPAEIKDALKKSKGLLDGLLGGKKKDD